MTAALDTHPNFGRPGQRPRHAYSPGDDFYDALIAAHRGLSDEQSELLQARLVLLLANHIGDLDVLQEAIALARRGVVASPADPSAAASAAPAALPSTTGPAQA